MAGKKIDYSAITNEILAYSDLCQSNSNIDPALYERYDVKRGLRDLNGKGVLTGLTEISEIRATKTVGGESIPCEGKLFYRGYNVEDLIRGARTDGRFGFEETVYLLLFGELPNKAQLTEFCKVLAKYRSLASECTAAVSPVNLHVSDDLGIRIHGIPVLQQIGRSDYSQAEARPFHGGKYPAHASRGQFLYRA